MRFLDGDDIGPTDRGIDLRGDEFRCVLMGDVARGGRLILPLRMLCTNWAGSGIVPAADSGVRELGSGYMDRTEVLALTLVNVHRVIS